MSTNFLIALMFVTILTLGIASILSYLAERLSGETWKSIFSKRYQWISLILLIHLNFFWQSTLIMLVDDWSFLGFIYMICGPIILFFSTNYLLSYTKIHPDSDSIGGRFYYQFVLLEAWVIGTYPVLGIRYDFNTYIHGLLLLIALLICFYKGKWLEKSFPVVAWLSILLILVLNGLN